MVVADEMFAPAWYQCEDAAKAVGSYTWKTARLGVHTEKGMFYLFTKSEAKDMLKLLVTNSYVQFAGKVYYQARGIPMGINPAVFLANLYLFLL